MDLIIIVALIGVGVVIGMYVASQVGEHIHSNVQNTELMENLRKLDKKDIMDSRIMDESYRHRDTDGL